jgi:SAM-dependent MidA family methyltransferase
MRFDAFMHFALYHPQWGYYAQGAHIFGKEGDFITAPELSPLFGQTIGQALRSVLPMCSKRIYEFGAGSGQLACDVLSTCGDLVDEYCIVEVSGSLKTTQAERIQAQCPTHMAQKVTWLTELPNTLNGIVLGNEVLDANPVRRFKLQDDQVLEAWVEQHNDQLTINWNAADAGLSEHVHTLNKNQGPWPNGYTSEIGEQSEALVRTLTERLNGLAIMIDYGHQEALYYHPSRTQGTLRATSRHVAHDDFLIRVGQQDLTAHVNFSAMYKALTSVGGMLEGYVSQAGFLMGNGILDLAAKHPTLLDPVKGAAQRQSLNTLLAESDMGEQFKVLVWSKGIDLEDHPFIHPLLVHDRSSEL